MENLEMTIDYELDPYDSAVDIKKHLYYRFLSFSARKQPVCKEWTVFPNFYRWALETGYQLGEKLCRYDTNEPYSPDNCCWRSMCSYEGRVSERERMETINRWNKTVNVFRKACGLPLFPVKEKTEGAEADA